MFGSVEPAVLSAAEIYFRFTAASFPFLGLYQIGAAFYRAGGNSRFPMKVSVISNVMNIIGNAIFIFGFGWGVAGAAFSTLLSRILAAIILFVFLRKPKQVIVMRDYRIRPDFDMIARILAIGIPSAPLFLLVLAILVVTALLHPTDRIADVTPSAAYAAAPFFAGFLEGYNTMDALASLAFGIVVINVIRGLGVTEPGAIAKNTVLSGIFSCLFMGGIYVAVTIVRTRSYSLTVSCTNGGEAFAVIAEHYLGRAGLVPQHDPYSESK